MIEPELLDDTKEDKDYRPPKRTSRKEPSSPELCAVFDEHGNELLEEVPIIVCYPFAFTYRATHSLHTVMKRKPKASTEDAVHDDGSTSSGDDLDAQLALPLASQQSQQKTKAQKVRRRSSSGKYKPPAKKAKKTHHSDSADNEPVIALEISDEDESDGESALRGVEEQEAKASGGKRGPKNETLKHWHGPIPTRDPKQGLRWEFKCRYCSAYVLCEIIVELSLPSGIVSEHFDVRMTARTHNGMLNRRNPSLVISPLI